MANINPENIYNTISQFLVRLSETGKVAFGILCAKEVYKDQSWNQWADKWLSGENRSEESAQDIANAAAKIAANAPPDAYTFDDDYTAYYDALAAYYAANAAFIIKQDGVNKHDSSESSATLAAYYTFKTTYISKSDFDFNKIFEKAKQYDTEQSYESFSIAPEHASVLNAYRSMYEAKDKKKKCKCNGTCACDSKGRSHKRSFGRNQAASPSLSHESYIAEEDTFGDRNFPGMQRPSSEDIVVQNTQFTIKPGRPGEFLVFHTNDLDNPLFHSNYGELYWLSEAITELFEKTNQGK